MLTSILLAALLMVDPVRTVVLVRHAERAGGTDPSVGISDAGRCRAESLSRMLSGAKVTAIYATEVKRTQQTAEPLSKATGVKTTIIPAKEIDKQIAGLRSGPAGTAVVVGHSNTVPELIQRLGAGPVEPIKDDEFDRMFVVTLIDPQRSSLLTLRYEGCRGYTNVSR